MLTTAHVASAHHRASEPDADQLVDLYPRLHDAALAGRAHAGRDVLDAGRPSDGRLSWSLVRDEARRLWRELHPSAEREHAQLDRERAPSWWVALAAPLVHCESRGDPHVVSAGGTYGGLYQFDEQTWRSVGGAGRPESASVDEQHLRGYKLWQSRGWQPWPVCGQLVR